MLVIKDLKCEFMNTPMGIDEEKPRLSWRIVSDKRDIYQSSYRVLCSYDESFKGIIFDSGVVASGEQNNICYNGDKLKPCSIIFWKVELCVGGVKVLSEVTTFETGMLNEVWQAKFITPFNPIKADGECGLLKTKLTLKSEPIKARLYITALGLYTAYINGERVGDEYLTPGWTSYRSWVRYQTYDVTKQLKCGDNIISSLLGNGWYTGRLMNKNPKLYGDTPSLKAQLVVETEDGIIVCATDDSWVSRQSQIRMSEIYDGEILDASRCSGLVVDDIEKCDPCRIIKIDDKLELIGQKCPPIRCIETLKPVEILITPRGETVLDFGQNIVGWVRISVDGEKGDRIKMLFGEILEKGNFYNTNMRSAKAEDLFILDDGMNVLEPHFTFHGFRYVKLEEFPGEPKLEQFTGKVLSSDLEYGSDFSCSNPKVNRLYQNVIWGQKGNFVDIPTDCPQRDERLGWTGDTQVFAATASYNALTPTFYEKWLKDLAIDQLDNGAVPHVIPDVLDATDGSAAWGDAAVIVPYVMYQYFNDKKVLVDQYESMKAWVEYIRNCGDDEYLWNTGFHYGDWLAKDGYGINITFGGTSKPIICSAMYYYSTTLFAEIAGILGNIVDKKEYEKLAKNIKKAFNDEFITKGSRVSSETQTAYTLALHFGLGDNKGKLIEHLVDLVRVQEHRITTGFVGTPYILHVLTDNGYVEDAYKMLLNEECPGWLYPVNKGATTIWERWDGVMANGELFEASMNSYNHYAYGAIAQWMYRVILGVEPNKAGFSEFNIAPKPMFFENAKGTIKTQYGDIKIEWSEGEKFSINMTIPPNTTANITLPRAKASDIDIKNAVGTIDGLVFKLGSGEYSFCY